MEITNYDQAAQLAREHAFAFYETCNCGGTLKHCYKRSPFYLELMPNKKMFAVKENDKYGRKLFTGKYDQLEIYLNEIKPKKK